ncbi:MAG: molybdate ABC transporter substrate-binding protein, partial [Burkholderiales bacterium]
VLTALHLWERVQGRLVQGDNIAQTLQFVQTGNAELGFVAQAQLLDIGNSGSHWKVPAALHDPIAQEGILLHDTPAGRAFSAFMQSAQSRALIEAAGYDLP